MKFQPTDIQQRVADDVHSRVNAHKPEGVSVMVVDADDLILSDDGLTIVARLIAKREYPNVALTGNVLYIERDALGAHRHEVVLEVS